MTNELTEEARRCRESASAAEGRGDAGWAAQMRRQAERLDRAAAEQAEES